MASVRKQTASVVKQNLLHKARIGHDAIQYGDGEIQVPEPQRDIIVAGRNFGCGSAREQASTAITGLGIRAVVAASSARTFYRNAINDGLTIVECPEVVAAVSEGDSLTIDLVNGLICHGDRHYPFPQIPASVRKILELGGLANYLKANLLDPPPSGPAR